MKSILLSLALGLPIVAQAGANNVDARAEMQRQLNQQVMASPFDPGDADRAEQYSIEARRQGVAPVMHPPGYWSPGWTCANLSGYAHYNYDDYRNCVYYHHYYGRYW